MKRTTTTTTATTTTATKGGKETMKKTATKAATKAATPAKKSPFDVVMERRARVEHLLTLANQGDTAARLELLVILSRAIAYHDRGKIEGLFSLDVACQNCSFCQAMQASENPLVICRLCYTQAMFKIATEAHAITGLILSQMELTDAEAAAIAVPAGIVRFNSDGELINLTHAVNLLKIAKNHTFSHFTLWTKRAEIIRAAIAYYGRPENLILGVSSPMINRPLNADDYRDFDFIFTVYTPRAIRAALESGSRECNGRKCKDCNFQCYRREACHKAGPVHVAEVLRAPKGGKADFEKLCAQIDALTIDAAA